MNQNAPSTSVANAASTVRAALVALGGYFVGKGVIDEGTAQAIVSVAMIVLPLLWAYIKNHNTKKIVQDAIDAPIGRAKP